MSDFRKESHEVEAFVITLDSLPRNKELLHELDQLGITSHTVKAIDGRLWTSPFDSSLVNVKRFIKLIGRAPTGPEVGCALSHLLCTREALKRNVKFALILEDDAVISSDLSQVLKVMKSISSTAPTIFQLYSPNGSVLDARTLLPVGAGSERILGRFYSPPHGAVAYLINRAAIEIFSSKSVVEGVADWPPYAHAFEFWGCLPSPIEHLGSRSTIESARSEHPFEAKFQNSYIQRLSAYLQLFTPTRVYEHSRSLGGFRTYVKCVLIRETLYSLRFFKSTSHKHGLKSYQTR